MKLRGKQCDANVSILFDSRSEKVFFFHSDASHTHSESATAVFRFTDAEKIFIRELVEAGSKPKQIKFNLARKNMRVPSDTKLVSILTRIRNETYGKERMNIGTLEKWLRENQQMPPNDTDPFVSNYEIDTNNQEDDTKFRFFITR